jgi:putative membrane protein
MLDLTTQAMLTGLDIGSWHGPGRWEGGPGWWLVFPVLFWLLVLTTVGYVIFRRTPTRSARSAAERLLAERYARGEISADELRERRNVLRGKA